MEQCSRAGEAASSSSLYRHFPTGSASVSSARYSSVRILFDSYNWAAVGILKPQFADQNGHILDLSRITICIRVLWCL